MFKAFWRKSGYVVYLKDSDDVLKAAMAFDTGAVCTVLSVEALTSELVDKETLCHKLDQKARRRRFLSASGTEMHGYLVCAESMSLSDYPIDKFYYYLIVDVDDVVALLGDDFISCCDFHHQKKEDISIVDFDKHLYETTYGGALIDDDVQALLAELTVSDE